MSGNGLSHTVSVLINNGTGQFTTLNSYAAGPRVAQVELVDGNDDPFLDAIISNESLWNGQGYF